MKRWLLIGIVLLVALSMVLVCCGGGGREEGQASGAIQVPGGPKIKVVFNGPPELKVEWEKLGMAPDGFQVQLIGTLKNVYSETVEFSEVAYLFDGNQVAFDFGRTLAPSEEMRITKGFPGYSERTKVLEVRVNGFKKAAALMSPAATATPTATSTPTAEPGTQIFTEAPKNPNTPAEVVAAFYFLLIDGRYSEAEKFFTQEALQDCESEGGLESVFKTYIKPRFKGQRVQNIQFEMIIEGNKAHTDSTIEWYFGDGSTDTFCTVDLVKVDGTWKICQ